MSPRGQRLAYERSATWRLFALVFALLVGLAVVLGAMVSAAQAAPIGGLKQFRIPTPDSDPKHITPGSDGNLWFTESDIESQNGDHNIGRITPAGEITEFPACDFCFPNNIVQGPNNILYFTQSNTSLGRITTSGQVLPDVVIPDPNGQAIANGITRRGNNLWFTDFNNNSIWRYNVSTGNFKQFPVPTPDANPFDVAVDANGIVWFTEAFARQIGRLDPTTGTITETPVQGDPRWITIATDGTVWFTERFSHAIGRLDPSTNQVTEFPTLTPNAGPEDIAAAPNGALWFTQFNEGNIARITSHGTITEVRRVKGSGAFGITIAPNGDPWYTMLRANKIATLRLR